MRLTFQVDIIRGLKIGARSIEYYLDSTGTQIVLWWLETWSGRSCPPKQTFRHIAKFKPIRNRCCCSALSQRYSRSGLKLGVTQFDFALAGMLLSVSDRQNRTETFWISISEAT